MYTSSSDNYSYIFYIVTVSVIIMYYFCAMCEYFNLGIDVSPIYEPPMQKFSLYKNNNIWF